MSPTNIIHKKVSNTTM